MYLLGISNFISGKIPLAVWAKEHCIWKGSNGVSDVGVRYTESFKSGHP